ncbi:hypothetical protein M422DRAFT_154383, partial [Sphaerobolus stellatus SS14]
GHEDWIMSVAFSPNSQLMFSGCYNSAIYVWNATTQERIRRFQHGHNDIVSCVAVSPDGQHIVSGSFDNTLCLWDIKTTHQIIGQPFQGHLSGIASIALSPDQ